MSAPLLPSLDSGPVTRREATALVVILALSLAARLLLLDAHGVRNNELITIRVLGLDWWPMIAERVSRNHMPLYFLGLKAWSQTAGMSDAALRLPSAVFGAAGIAALWWVGRLMLGSQVGLAAAALGALHEQWLEMSLDARMYSQVMTLALVGIGAAWLWFTDGRRRWAALHVAVMIVGLLTHLLLVTVSLSLACFAARRVRPRRVLMRTLFTLALPLLVMIPLMLWWSRVQYKIGTDHWDIPSVGRLMRNVIVVIFGDYEVMGPDGKDAVRAVEFPLIGVSIAAALWWTRRRVWQAAPAGTARVNGFALILWIAALPPALAFIAGFKSTSTLDTARYLAVSTAVAPILLAACWWGIPSRWTRAGALSLAAVLMSVQSALFIARGDEGLRAAMDYLRGVHFPNRAVVSCASWASRTAFIHYGVDQPVTRLDREERDSVAIINTVRQALGPSGQWLYLFRYRAEDSPAYEILHEDTPWLHMEETHRFGACRVNVFRVVGPIP